MIIEVAGRPAEHLKKALEDHVEKLNNLKGVSLISKEFVEPKLIEDEKQIFTCHSEVEVEVETLFRLTELIFDFMPSSVEVLEPETVKLSAQESTMFLNDLSGRLHKYDEIVKVAQMKNQQLFHAYQNLQGQIAENSKKQIKKSTKKKKKS